MTDTSNNILLSDVQGQGFLSIFNDLSSELMPHELSLLELMEGLDYDGFDSTLRRDASVVPQGYGNDRLFIHDGMHIQQEHRAAVQEGPIMDL